MNLKNHYNNLIENNPAGICVLKEGEIAYCNSYFKEIFKKNKSQLLGKKFIKWVDEKFKIKVMQAFKLNIISRFEFRIKIGEEKFWLYAGINNIFSKNNTLTYITVFDITEKKKKEVEKKAEYFHDQLTGLYNRHFFEAEIKRLDVERNYPLSVIIGDANNLKLINDAFGHQKGDQYLKEISRVLKESLRDEDIISRWGGDEFGIILPKTPLSQAEEICRRIKEMCADCNQFPFTLSIALGAAVKKDLD